MSHDELDWIVRAGAKAKGKRPQYFDDPAQDRMLSILLAVVGEVAVLKERLDTVERLLDANGTVTRADIEGYEPDRTAAEERGIATKAYIARVMRGVQQDMEAMAAAKSEPPIQQLVDDLAKS